MPRSSERVRPLGSWVGVLALLVFAGLTMAAPQTASGGGPTPDHWLERAFPGTPAAWTLLRLACLAAGAWLVARGAGFESKRPDVAAAAVIRAPSRRRATLAAVLGGACVALSLARGELSRAGEALFLAALLAPALVLAARPMPRSGNATRGLSIPPESLPIGVWLIWQIACAPSDALSPSLVDTWLGFQYAEEAIATPRRLLSEGALPGLSGVYLFLQGVPVFGGPLPLSYEGLRSVAVAWIAATALGVARLARGWCGAPAGPVAATVFLFAPFTLMMPASPTPYYLGPGVGVAALLLAERARSGSAAASSALGAVFGIVPTIPLALPAVGVAALRVAVAFVRGTRAEAPVAVASALVFVAAALVAVPAPDTVERMMGAYAASHGEWAGLESALFGQTSALDVIRAWEQPLRGALDVAAAGLIAPFAVARTPMRGWADALFDPIGTALMAVGLALALRRAPSCAWSRWALLLFVASLAPGLVSSFDRPSVTRMGTLLVGGPLLAGLAAGAGASRIAAPRRNAAIVSLCLAIAIAGSTLFLVVNPRLLRQSSLAISLEAIETRPDGVVAFLDYPSPLDVSWLHVRRIGTALGRPPVATIPIDALAPATAAIDRAPHATHVLLWSPGLEGDRDVARSLCQRWPRSAVFRLEDATGRSHAFAIRIGAGTWQPALPASRWREHRCGEPLTTS